MTAAKPKKGLGRGLSALISQAPVSVVPPRNETTDEPKNKGKNPALDVSSKIASFPDNAENAPTSGATERIRYIPIKSLHNNPGQPRQHFDDKEISELADSIKTLGLLQPILVRNSKTGEGYEIIAGERRWRAAQKASLSQVPVILRDTDDRLSLEIAIVENVQRSNLTPIEEAMSYKKLVDDFSLSQKEVAEKVGKDRTTVTNLIRLLSLPQKIIDLIAEDKITVGHAKAILTVKEPGAQLSLAKKVVDENLSVRALEDIVSRVVVLDTGKPAEENQRKNSAKSKSAFPDFEDKLRKALGTKVAIKHQPTGSGKIEIKYFSEEELDRILDQMLETK